LSSSQKKRLVDAAACFPHTSSLAHHSKIRLERDIPLDGIPTQPTIDAMSIQALRISEVLSNGPKPGPFSRFISMIKNNSINTRAMTGGFIWVLHCLNPLVSNQGDDSA
jgi:hypothetical protein